MSLGATLTSAALRADTIDDDLEVAAAAGLTHLRFTVPWAIAQPKPDMMNGDVVESYRSAALACRAAGIEPWFALLEPAVPRWFDNEGGFTEPRQAARWWPRWVETCAQSFGDVVAGWIPFEAPLAMANRLIPNDPARHGELLDTIVVAWRDAWRILRGGPPVASSLDVRVVRPTDDSREATEIAQREDRLRWQLWMRSFTDGTIVIPGRADRELADLAGAVDVVGIAIRGEVETLVYRLAEVAPSRPLAVTFRPTGDTTVARASSTTSMWRELARAVNELPIQRVTFAPFLDPGDGGGLVTTTRSLTDAGREFVEGGQLRER